MQVRIAELEKMMIEILLNHGMKSDHARIIVEDYLDAEMRGKVSHGIRAFPDVLDGLGQRGEPRVTLDTGHLLCIDGNGESGHIVSRTVLEWATLACAKHGHAIAGMKNVQRIASPGSMARLGAESGMISIIIEYGGQAFMAPVGSADPVLSTNPLGVGIPTSKDPLVIDMATSVKAFYFVALAQEREEEIPRSWGLDADGWPTSDPAKVRAVSPFGSYKGFALAFVFEILAGILTGVDVGLRGDLSRRGVLAVFIDPTIFGLTLDEYRAKLSQLIHDIKNSRVAPGYFEILIPGERSTASRARSMRTGTVDIDRKTYHQLQILQNTITDR